jgi:hypothetical protein
MAISNAILAQDPARAIYQFKEVTKWIARNS